VIEVITDKALVVVEGVNIVKKHEKQVRAKDGSVSGGIIETEAPIPVANVALVDPATGRATRVGFKIEGGKKVRVARTKGTGTVLDK
jgi:large subunit ribosomal protein L24